MVINELKELVLNTINNINSKEKLSSFLDFMGKGNIYYLSLDNILAVYAQNSSASAVFSFNMWKKYGRYPNGNTGIAVFKKTIAGNNFSNNISDYMYDISGTKGKDYNLWSLTADMADRLMNYYYESQIGSSEFGDDFYKYMHSIFYKKISSYSISVDNSLMFSEDIRKRYELHNFIADCCAKVFIKRIGLPYKLSAESSDTFNNFIMKNGVLDTDLLTHCLSAVQGISCNELEFVNAFILNEMKLDEERRSKDEQNNDRKRVGSSHSEIREHDGAGSQGISGRGRGDNRVSRSESGDFVWSQREKNTEFSKGGVSREDVSDGIGQQSGEFRKDQSTGSNGYISQDNHGIEGKGGSVESPVFGEGEGRRADSSYSEGVRGRDFIQTSGRIIDNAEYVAVFKYKTKEKFNNIDGMNSDDIENMVVDYVNEKITEYKIDAIINGVAVVGSRCRGLEHNKSDLDVVIEYTGMIREDDMFNMLHSEEFSIGNIIVDINPITKDVTGTLSDYLKDVESYLEEKVHKDIDETVLNYAQMKAAASDNPLIKEKMEIDAEVTRLQLIKRNFTHNKYKLQSNFEKVIPKKIEKIKNTIELVTKDIELRNSNPFFSSREENQYDISAPEVEIAKLSENDASAFAMKLNGITYDKRVEAGEYIKLMFSTLSINDGTKEIGEYMVNIWDLKFIFSKHLLLIEQSFL